MHAKKVRKQYEFRTRDFYEEIERRLMKQGLSWRQLALEIGATPSTFTRFAAGRSLDGRTLAALAAWAGLNPAEFVGSNKTAMVGSNDAERFEQVLSEMCNEAGLTLSAARAFKDVCTTTYAALKEINSVANNTHTPPNQEVKSERKKKKNGRSVERPLRANTI